MYRLCTIVVLLFCAVPREADAQRVTFAGVGDIFFGRAGKEYGTDAPFRHVAPLLAGRDVVMGNLETPVTAERRRITKPPCMPKKNNCLTDRDNEYRRLYFLTFQGRPDAARLLKEGGFTVLSTANNHAEDQGPEGMLDTLQHLNEAGLGAAGTGPTRDDAWTPYIFEKDGVRTGVIAVTTLSNFRPSEKGAFVAATPFPRILEVLPERVRRLRPLVDFVVVTLHYSSESTHFAEHREWNLIRELSAAGADLFIGTHPHVLRGISKEGPMVVFWSMGNFLFDNSKGAWGESGIVLATFVKDGETRTLVEVAFQPVALDGKPAGLPRPLTGREARQINRKVMDYSRQFRNPKGFLRIDGDRIAIDPSAGTTESTPGPR